jgi:dipeptidyl aminopeptidase/acylaminoacyl peptidase
MRSVLLYPGMLLFSAAAVASQRPPLDSFFAGQRIEQVSIAPDGRYLALIVSGGGLHYVTVADRQAHTAPKPVTQLDPKDHTSFNWCTWAKADRVLCSVMFTTDRQKISSSNLRWARNYFGSTRLIAFDADGGNDRTLVEHGSDSAYGGQIQDDVIDWLPDDPDTVLIQLPDSKVVAGFGPRAVWRLNIRTNQLQVSEYPKQYVARFATDGRGHVRLASGVYDTTLHMFARKNGSNSWDEIVKRQIELASESHHLEPQFVIPDSDDAYAIGDYQGYEALWKVPMTANAKPQLVFAQPGADVRALFGPDRQLLGVAFDTDAPNSHYLDTSAQHLKETADRALPGHINRLTSFSRDMKTAVVRSDSDESPPTFYVLDMSASPTRLTAVGSSYPGLKGFDLSQTDSVTFRATDGVTVTAYLTRPSGDTDLARTPLIVLPHGGPYARDRWGFDTWVQFLASRGYAVLQVEFRGSTGLGHEWFEAGFADWSGKPYSDVIDGTRWALSKGYGDPQRTCIVGASFGGYIAQLAATRNSTSKLFKCAVSISGVSDLRKLMSAQHWFAGWRLAEQAIGTDSEKLRDASPLVHAGDVSIPIMLIHGDHDFTVTVEQSIAMDDVLTKADKPHELVIVKGADHYFRDDEYLKTMFVAMDGFLGKQLAEH